MIQPLNPNDKDEGKKDGKEGKCEKEGKEGEEKEGKEKEDDKEEKETVSSQPAVDVMTETTMKLLVNKNQYKNWLSKKDPTKYQEKCEFFEKMRRRHGEINELFEQLMKNPEQIITTDVNECFESFARACMMHLECQDVSSRSLLGPTMRGCRRRSGIYSEEEDDTMFGEMDPETTKSIDDYSFVMRNLHRRRGNNL